MAYIEEGGDPRRFVMTTWHDDEAIEDVVDFWWWNTTFEDFIPTEFVVFFLGSDSEIETSLMNRIAFHQRNESEQAGAANPHAFGTFGTSAAEQPWVPKASGDT